LGFRKGYSKKSGKIIQESNVDGYPNVWDEFYPFLFQMKELSKKTQKKIL